MKTRTMSPEERAQERLVSHFIPARSHILCPVCGEPMSWKCEPEIIRRDGFPVSTGLFWGKIWCRCGLAWEASPWPRVGILLRTLPTPEKAAKTGRTYLRKYRGAQRKG